VQIVDGSMVLRLQKHGRVSENRGEIESSSGGRPLSVCGGFEHLNARLAALRIQSPREKGVRIDILRLATVSSDPKLTIEDALGARDDRRPDDGRGPPAGALSGDTSSARAAPCGGHASHGPVGSRDACPNSATLADLRFLDPRFSPTTRS
jgi:hypothetical protein